jgi:glycine/D-amino acid oxidase-like deaminating enzyme
LPLDNLPLMDGPGRKRIIVVGGGIAGLTAAYTLQKDGFDVANARRIAGVWIDGARIDNGAALPSRTRPLQPSSTSMVDAQE